MIQLVKANKITLTLLVTQKKKLRLIFLCEITKIFQYNMSHLVVSIMERRKYLG